MRAETTEPELQVKTEPADLPGGPSNVAERDEMLGERGIKNWKPDVEVTFKGSCDHHHHPSVMYRMGKPISFQRVRYLVRPARPDRRALSTSTFLTIRTSLVPSLLPLSFYRILSFSNTRRNRSILVHLIIHSSRPSRSLPTGLGQKHAQRHPIRVEHSRSQFSARRGERHAFHRAWGEHDARARRWDIE